ncbi:MAG: omptin family outer membrane protease [Treponema sp.]|jgi:outer membrane protease|nr:omptin family outer membrane protease [Treponema sp.]
MAHRFFHHTIGTITAFAILVIIFFSAQPVQAQEGYAVSLSPLFGMAHGHAEEIVYPAGNTRAPLLSELLWDIKPVFYYGFSLGFSQVDPRERWGFFSSLALKTGIPGTSGYLEDRDWMSVENANLTHYSKHYNYTREMFLLDAGAGLSFPFKRLMLLKTCANVSFTRLSFFGMDGYGIYARRIESGIYAPIYDDPENADFSGKKVISYTQEWLTVALGVSFGYFFQANFLAELTFLVSPLVFCVDLDEHKERSNQYRDYLLGGLSIEPGMRLSLTASRWLDISWEFSWRHVRGTRGATYVRNPIGTGIWAQEGEAGAGLSIINTSLALKIKL